MIIPGILSVAAVSASLPVVNKVAKVPPTKAPIIPSKMVPSIPLPRAAGSIALAIAPAIRPKINQAIMFMFFSCDVKCFSSDNYKLSRHLTLSNLSHDRFVHGVRISLKNYLVRATVLGRVFKPRDPPRIPLFKGD